MHPITAWMAQRLYYLFVILHFATTAIMYSSQALIHAHPIVAHKEPLPSPHPALFPRQAEVWTIFTPPAGSTPSSTPTSDNPSLTLPSPSPTSTDTPVTVIQKPLVQIVSPNVTFFAALDIVSSGSPSAFPTQYPTLPPLPANDNNTSHIPLLLPVSSLSILPNQIYHVDDERMFGAGGPDPLTVNNCSHRRDFRFVLSCPVRPTVMVADVDSPILSCKLIGYLGRVDSWMCFQQERSGRTCRKPLDRVHVFKASYILQFHQFHHQPQPYEYNRGWQLQYLKDDYHTSSDIRGRLWSSGLSRCKRYRSLLGGEAADGGSHSSQLSYPRAFRAFEPCASRNEHRWKVWKPFPDEKTSVRRIVKRCCHAKSGRDRGTEQKGDTQAQHSAQEGRPRLEGGFRS
ncbi:hypothetical protein B0O80DRAFT_97807 [Mortierella sp. GBAus27b]|nr:hypothetical protein B0O80DRAFT_97807 [Mortierella sp. GBAus27b]